MNHDPGCAGCKECVQDVDADSPNYVPQRTSKATRVQLYDGAPFCQVCGSRDAYVTSDGGPICHRQECIDFVKARLATGSGQPAIDFEPAANRWRKEYDELHVAYCELVQERDALLNKCPDSQVNEEREHVLTHLRNAATVARNRAAEITLNGNPADAKKYSGRAGHLGQFANEIEKGKHLPKGRRRAEMHATRCAGPTYTEYGTPMTEDEVQAAREYVALDEPRTSEAPPQPSNHRHEPVAAEWLERYGLSQSHHPRLVDLLSRVWCEAVDHARWQHSVDRRERAPAFTADTTRAHVGPGPIVDAPNARPAESAFPHCGDMFGKHECLLEAGHDGRHVDCDGDHWAARSSCVDASVQGEFLLGLHRYDHEARGTYQHELDAQRLRALLDAVRRETIEACAKACEALIALWKPTDPGHLESVNSMEHIKHGAWECARAIRALPFTRDPLGGTWTTTSVDADSPLTFGPPGCANTDDPAARIDDIEQALRVAKVTRDAKRLDDGYLEVTIQVPDRICKEKP